MPLAMEPDQSKESEKSGRSITSEKSVKSNELRFFSKYRWECKQSISYYFCKHINGWIKIVSLILLTVSYIMMKKTKTANMYIPVILVMESFLFFFFIFANLLAFPRYIKLLIWPVFDMLNDFFAFVYLAYAGFYSILHPPGTMDTLYWTVAGFILAVAFLSLLDVILQSCQIKHKKTKA